MSLTGTATGSPHGRAIDHLAALRRLFLAPRAQVCRRVRPKAKKRKKQNVRERRWTRLGDAKVDVADGGLLSLLGADPSNFVRVTATGSPHGRAIDHLAALRRLFLASEMPKLMSLTGVSSPSSRPPLVQVTLRAAALAFFSLLWGLTPRILFV
jgi:hypothetical protein